MQTHNSQRENSIDSLKDCLKVIKAQHKYRRGSYPIQTITKRVFWEWL